MIHIASINMRGKWAQRPENSITLNVTSMQSKTRAERRDFSPMNLGKGYKGFHCFENFWQAGKVYADIDRNKQIKWWLSQKKGIRRYPGTKEKKVMYANYDGRIVTYIQSRKEVYVPEYYDLMIKTKSFKKYLELSKTNVIVVVDFDGPRGPHGELMCLPLTKELLIEKINDTTKSFGHGYIIAGALVGIHYSEYCS